MDSDGSLHDDTTRPPLAGGIKRKWKLFAGAGLLLVVALGAAWWQWGYKERQETAEKEAATLLPLSEESNPYALPPLEEEPPTKVAVAIKYTAGTPPVVQIASVEETDRATIDYYPPQEGSAIYQLRFLTETGEVALEKQFGIEQAIIAESFEGDSITGELYELPEQTAYVSVPIEPGVTVRRVQLLAMEGEVLDEEEAHIVGKEVIEGGEPLSQVLGSVAQAQGGDSTLDLLVTNELNGVTAEQVSSTATTVENLMRSEPWGPYTRAGRVRVTPIHNTGHALGCSTAPNPNFGGGILIPICNNYAALTQAANSLLPGWDVIIVLNNMNGRGLGATSSLTFPQLAISTSDIGLALLQHELGHALGRLGDEYGYQFGRASQSVPNCFTSLNACQQAIEPFITRGVGGQPVGAQQAQCSAGCSSASEWRPANRVMHNITFPLFGPLEACLMRQQISHITRIPLNSNCEVHIPPTPRPRPTQRISPSQTPTPVELQPSPHPTSPPGHLSPHPTDPVQLSLDVSEASNECQGDAYASLRVDISEGIVEHMLVRMGIPGDPMVDSILPANYTLNQTSGTDTISWQVSHPGVSESYQVPIANVLPNRVVSASVQYSLSNGETRQETIYSEDIYPLHRCNERPVLSSPAPVVGVPGEGSNLAVSVRYKHSRAGLSLSIDSIERIRGRTTIEFYKPPAGEPYSLLILRGANGEILLSEPFWLPDTITGEGPSTSAEIIPTTEGVAYLVVPLPSGTPVHTIELARSTGVPWDSMTVGGLQP